MMFTFMIGSLRAGVSWVHCSDCSIARQIAKTKTGAAAPVLSVFQIGVSGQTGPEHVQALFLVFGRHVAAGDLLLIRAQQVFRFEVHITQHIGNGVAFFAHVGGFIFGFVAASILVNSGHLTRMKRSGRWAAA